MNALRRLADSEHALSVQKNDSEDFDNFSKNDINPALKQTPLLASIQWGLIDVTKCLLSNLNCKIYAQVILKFIIYLIS